MAHHREAGGDDQAVVEVDEAGTTQRPRLMKRSGGMQTGGAPNSTHRAVR